MSGTWNRALRVLGATAIGIAAFSATPHESGAQAPAPDAVESTARLRDQAEMIRRTNLDAAAGVRASRYLELTERRSWGYFDDAGGARSVEAAYDMEVVRSGQPCVLFTSRQYVPVSRLDARGTADLAELGKLRTELRQDYLNMQSELARRQAEAIEAQRQAEMRRQAELEKMRPRQARLLVDTDMTVVENGQSRVLNLAAGEVFEVVGESPSELLLLIGGRPTPVDRRRLEELRGVVALRPISPAAPGPVVPLPDLGGPRPAIVAVMPVDPPRLDCRIGSYQFPDGRAALQVEAVAVGGLADRYQLQAGDVIERVNDLAVGTLDDYRIASTRAGGALKLVVFRPVVGRSWVIEIPAPQTPVALGVFGHIDFRQEFVVDDVLEGSIAARMGLKRDDKLLRVNELPITSEAQLRQVEATSGGRFRIRAIVHGEPKTLVFP